MDVPCGLYFLPIWRLMHSRAFYMAAQGLKKDCFRKQGGCCIGFHNLAVKAHALSWLATSQALAVSVLLFSMDESSPSLLQFMERKHRFPSHWGEESEEFVAVFRNVCGG